MKLKLEYYILGLLAVNSLTGYEIKKYFDTEGRFESVKAPLSQIYTTLKRMHENDLVSFEEERRDSKPDLKIYSITAQGRKLLVDFLRTPIKPSFRHNDSSIFFHIRYAFLVEPEVMIGHIQDELDFRHKQIAKFRHRDRTLHSTILSPSELAQAQAINDELHNHGAARMDLYVADLQRMLTFFENQKPTARITA